MGVCHCRNSPFQRHPSEPKFPVHSEQPAINNGVKGLAFWLQLIRFHSPRAVGLLTKFQRLFEHHLGEAQQEDREDLDAFTKVAGSLRLQKTSISLLHRLLWLLFWITVHKDHENCDTPTKLALSLDSTRYLFLSSTSPFSILLASSSFSADSGPPVTSSSRSCTRARATKSI